MFGLATLDLDLKITQWTGWLTELTGWAEGDVIGLVILEVFPELKARGFEAIFQHVLDTRAPLVLSHILHKTIFPSKDGVVAPQSALIQPIRQNENLTGLLIAVQNVSERTEMEADPLLRIQHLESLHVIDQLVLSGDLDATLDSIVLQAGTLFGALYAEITLLENHRLVLAASCSQDQRPEAPQSMDVGQGLIGRAARSGQLVLCRDVRADPAYISIDPRTVAKMAVPIRAGELIFGVLNVESEDPAKFDGEAPQMLQSLADEAAVALQADQARRRERSRMRSLELLRQLGVKLTAARDLTAIYNLGVEYAVRLLDATVALIFLYRPCLDTTGDKGGPADKLADTGLRFVAGPGIPGLPRPEFSSPIPGGLTHTVARTRQPYIFNEHEDSVPFSRRQLQKNKLKAVASYPLLRGEHLLGVLNVGFMYDHTVSRAEQELLSLLVEQLANHIENTRLHGLAMRNLARLDALRHVDQAIIASFDLKISMNVLLGQLLTQLEVDAAAVLRYQKDLHTLTFFQGRGFRTKALQHTNIGIGHGLAGKVALQRCPLFIPDLSQDEDAFPDSSRFKDEGFRAYYAVPLVAKNAINGVLEIFHRSALEPDVDWEGYLELMANQAAIAIDNLTLFDDLQRSNLDLTLAYDATIEGWARALEIRDMETEGHSQRVVDLTIKLAQQMGIFGQELVDIRRGARLHDIGKMGVPDSILQKPGPLTEEEWRIMRKHPVYAYEWLSPIDYLRNALDIPYYHHEKWDGTGYPCGLKEQQIPLAARIFSILDVWDALNSKRPYRKAWPADKAMAYIRQQRDIHFDPQACDAFLAMIDRT